MELPDEAIGYNYQNLLTPLQEEWTPAAEMRASHFLHPSRFKELHQRLLQCRSQLAAERELRQVPAESLPLEPGFINLPQDLLDNLRRKQDASEVGRVLNLANRLRENSDRVVFLGSGGSYLGAQALFGALRGTYHNELPPETRLGIPRIYFEGHGADNDAFQELLDLLQITCVDPEQREERWSVVTISKSGTSLDPSVAFRIFRREATEYYGLRSPWLNQLFAVVTGPSTPLRDLARNLGLPDDGLLTIPENVGSRFSVFTPAGLLPAALMGLDVRALLQGAALMSRRFLEEPVERNPVLQLAGINYLMHAELRKPLRVMALWSRKLAGVGAWYEQLVSECLGKQSRGPTPLSVVMPRDLHIRGQQILEGPRDHFVTNLIVKTPQTVPILIQMADRNEDELNQFNRKGLSDITQATLKSVTQHSYDVGRPTADLLVPTLSEHTIGQLLQLLMLATVVEARLMGINPYGQRAVEGQRRQILQTLKAMPDAAPSHQGGTLRP
jgi:glucose-6-phosphate isomerase